jgi:hypothetical protein
MLSRITLILSSPRPCLDWNLRRSNRGGGEDWAGMAKAVVKQKCGWCGQRISRVLRRTGPHPDKAKVCCPSCSHWNYIAVRWLPDPEGEPYDPHFGFKLWLQTRCSGEILWAYNGKHLAFLRDYVSALLRERKLNANGSLASRLLKWIKRAENRSAILRAIERLEGKNAS